MRRLVKHKPMLCDDVDKAYYLKCDDKGTKDDMAV
jgi:hypothetical protein